MSAFHHLGEALPGCGCFQLSSRTRSKPDVNFACDSVVKPAISSVTLAASFEGRAGFQRACGDHCRGMCVCLARMAAAAFAMKRRVNWPTGTVHSKADEAARSWTLNSSTMTQAGVSRFALFASVSGSRRNAGQAPIPAQASARITSQKWRAGPGIEPSSRDFRGRGGFAVCCPQGEHCVLEEAG